MPKRNTILIQVGERTYPFRMTLGAMLRFKRLTGKEATELDEGSVEEVASLLYACLASASAADKVAFDFSFEEFCDNLSAEDMEAMKEFLMEADEPPADSGEADGAEKKS